MAMLLQYLYRSREIVPKEPDALRIGLLSTANINSMAVMTPARSHSGVIISAVASRTLEKAQEYAKKFGIPKAYGSYEDLLNEPGIDAVYIGLPNGMHGTWAKKALNAGKHVLLEKPFTANAEEARSLVELARQKNLVLLEAFHWQFHPAAHSVKALIDSGKYGPILRTYSRMLAPKGLIQRNDVRWQYDLAGGTLMDFTYVVSGTRFFLGAGTPLQVIEAKARPSPDPRVDEAMEATLTYELDGRVVESKIHADMWRSHFLGVIPRVWAAAPSIEIETEHAVIYFYNFVLPHWYHYVTIYDKRTKQTTTEKYYSGGSQWKGKGEAWWSTYRHQLEAFVDMVRERKPAHLVTLDDSILQMETIDMIYEQSGLGKRQPTSETL